MNFVIEHALTIVAVLLALLVICVIWWR